MHWLLKIATLGPVGYAPCSGTLASLLAFPILYALRLISLPLYLGVTVIGCILGYFSVAYALDFFKHRDPAIIVYDEVVGVMVLLCIVPSNFRYAFMGFVLFRIFDGSKVLGIGWFEKVKGTWGVILDDVVSALYAGALISLASIYGIL
jgi:phosphatidylglycerophosphatase A